MGFLTANILILCISVAILRNMQTGRANFWEYLFTGYLQEAADDNVLGFGGLHFPLSWYLRADLVYISHDELWGQDLSGGCPVDCAVHDVLLVQLHQLLLQVVVEGRVGEGLLVRHQARHTPAWWEALGLLAARLAGGDPHGLHRWRNLWGLQEGAYATVTGKISCHWANRHHAVPSYVQIIVVLANAFAGGWNQIGVFSYQPFTDIHSWRCLPFRQWVLHGLLEIVFLPSAVFATPRVNSRNAFASRSASLKEAFYLCFIPGGTINGPHFIHHFLHCLVGAELRVLTEVGDSVKVTFWQHPSRKQRKHEQTEKMTRNH